MRAGGRRAEPLPAAAEVHVLPGPQPRWHPLIGLERVVWKLVRRAAVPSGSGHPKVRLTA